MSDLAGLSDWCRAAPREMQAEFRKLSKEIGEDAAAEARAEVYPAFRSAPRHNNVSARTAGRSSTGARVAGRRKSRGTGLGATARSIKAKGDRSGIAFTLGGPSAPAAMGHEFGGGRKLTTRQFPIHSGRRGYFFYPTIRANAQELLERYADAVEELWPRNL